MEIAFRTDVGKVRKHNEDTLDVFRTEDAVFAVVADGMGGHQAGDVASRIAVAGLKKAWENEQPHMEEAEVSSWLSEKIQGVNNEIFQQSMESAAFQGMGTTIVAGIFFSNMLISAHVGDSRAYLFYENEARQLTSDHSLVNELVKTGQISPGEAENHEQKNVLVRALGTDLNVEVEMVKTELPPASKVLFCSDGLSDKLPLADLVEAIQASEDVHMNADELMRKALARGGEDNISLILLHDREPVREEEQS